MDHSRLYSVIGLEKGNDVTQGHNREDEQENTVDRTKRAKRILSYMAGTVFSNPDTFVDPDTKPHEGHMPFDSYHYPYYERRDSEFAIRNASEQTVWDHLNMKVARGGVPHIYVPTAITGGFRSHKLAEEVDHRLPVTIGDQTVLLRTTKDLDKSSAGSERVVKDVIMPNQRDAMGRREHLQRMFPEFILTFPFNKEGAVHMNRADADVSYSRSPEEEDFMGGWYTEVDESVAIIHERDIPFSRNSNWEDMRGIMNALGYTKGFVRSDSDYVFYRGDRTLLTLAEIAQGQLEYLIYALDKDFYAREASTTLAWIMEVDSRMSDAVYNGKSKHPIDVLNVSKQFQNEYSSDEPWAVEARAKMAEIKRIAEPLIKRHFIGHIPEEFMAELGTSMKRARKNIKPLELQTTRSNEVAPRPVDKSLDEKLKEARLKANDPVIAEIKERLEDIENYRYLQKAGRGSELVALKTIATPVFKGEIDVAPKAVHTVSTPKQIVHKENVFDPNKFGTKIFDRNFFDRVKSKRERIAVTRGLGAMNTQSPPYGRPGWTFISADLKRGEFGRKAANDMLVSDIAELEAFYPDSDLFVDDVVKPSISATEAVVEAEKKDQIDAYGLHGPVISSVDIDIELKQAYGMLTELTAITGPASMSSEATMAYRMAIMDLMVDTVRLADNDWANSDKQVNHVVRATLIQLGLANRGDMHPYNMVLKNADGEEMDLLDRVKPIAEYLQYCVKHGVKAPEQAWGAAVLVQLHEMLIDPDYNKDRGDGHDIVNYDNVHESFADYRYDERSKEMDQLVYGNPKGETEFEKAGLRRFIFENCVDWLDYEEIKNDLDYDFYYEWTRNKGRVEGQIAPESPAARFGVRGRPDFRGPT